MGVLFPHFTSRTQQSLLSLVFLQVMLTGSLAVDRWLLGVTDVEDAVVSGPP
jgi:hypothetical protein